MIRRPPRSTQGVSSAASDVYKRQDNYQESPFKGVAHRTSPTNIGMGLIAQVVAYDLGYITLFDLVDKIDIILYNMNELEKIKGHYLNWYDTRTCLLYTSPSPRDLSTSRMPSSA
eukprot:TRINITY_DN27569_c0_g1_i1.p2 TRINITY_DN27569_c0_g1~~TRINITY_DN27569_c0_g1_i1.p2  ORF type:complete len:115 (-),score=20.67 TRINITY_DN27569_c0_g1_i1:106-450(-)